MINNYGVKKLFCLIFLLDFSYCLSMMQQKNSEQNLFQTMPQQENKLQEFSSFQAAPLQQQKNLGLSIVQVPIVQQPIYYMPMCTPEQVKNQWLLMALQLFNNQLNNQITFAQNTNNFPGLENQIKQDISVDQWLKNVKNSDQPVQNNGVMMEDLVRRFYEMCSNNSFKNIQELDTIVKIAVKFFDKVTFSLEKNKKIFSVNALAQPFFNACFLGNTAVVKCLLRNHILEKINGLTVFVNIGNALYPVDALAECFAVACAKGYTDIVSRFLEHAILNKINNVTVPINVDNKKYDVHPYVCSLFTASRNGYVNIVTFLLNEYVSKKFVVPFIPILINNKVHHGNVFALSLYEAVVKRHTDVVACFVDKQIMEQIKTVTVPFVVKNSLCYESVFSRSLYSACLQGDLAMMMCFPSDMPRKNMLPG